MALARTILALAPVVLKTRARQSGKRLVGSALSLTCLVLAGLFLMAAGFVWIMKSYGAEFGFFAVAITFFVIAALTYFMSRGAKDEIEQAQLDIGDDPLSKYVPEDMQNDPRIVELIEKVQAHPTGSTAAAVALGFILSTQILGR